MRRAVLTLLATLGFVFALVSPAVAYPPDPPSPEQSAAQLAELTVAAPGSSAGYSRDEFPHWSPAEGTCNTREMVLVRDGSGVTTGADCHPTDGRWYWWCYYARHWTDVKYDWDLTVTAAEKNALQDMVGTC